MKNKNHQTTAEREQLCVCGGERDNCSYTQVAPKVHSLLPHPLLSPALFCCSLFRLSPYLFILFWLLIRNFNFNLLIFRSEIVGFNLKKIK